MRKLKLLFKNEYSEFYGCEESVDIYLDGELIAHGAYGGEPEDNTRNRDYMWVERALTKLAKKLGCEVEEENHISCIECGELFLAKDKFGDLYCASCA